jgi:diguanylate cyclase (GGDEF)-like protein
MIMHATGPPSPERHRRERARSALARLNDALEARGPAVVERVAILSLVLLGLVDFLVGPELSLSLFYLFPIAVGVWYGSARMGVSLSLLAGAAWLSAALFAGVTYAAGWIMVWNVAIRVANFLLVVLLVNELKRALQTQRRLALFEPLTGLANSRAFLQRLSAEIERSQRYGRVFTLAYLDLDRFKEVNDTRGHAEGDRVLQVIAGTLEGSIRTSDLVARLGGDEFGILLPETPYHQAEAALTKVSRSVGTAMREGGWPVGVSIGAVTFEIPADSADEAVRLTDHLMYRMKAEGRGGIRHELWTGEDERGGPPSGREAPSSTPPGAPPESS